MDILFVAGFGPITTDPAASADFYAGTLGLPLETIAGDYMAMEGFDGVKHFGVWPLADAATACFGSTQWPAEVRVPNSGVEFEVPDVAVAAEELEASGHVLLHGARLEPWGQTVARLLSPEGLLVGLCQTPGLH